MYMDVQECKAAVWGLWEGLRRMEYLKSIRSYNLTAQN